MVGALLTSAVAHAGGVEASGEVVCKTRAGYLRISSTGECRRSEVQVDLPQGPQGAQGEQGPRGEQGEAGPQGLPGKDSDPQVVASLDQAISGFQQDVISLKSEVSKSQDKVDLTGVVISGTRDGLALPYTTLADANFAYAHLGNAFFYGANLSGANFYMAYLNGSSLQRVNAESAHFDGAVMTFADLSYSDFSNAYFGNAGGSAWTVLRYATMTNVDFTGATFVQTDLGYTRLPGAKFSGATLISANLDNADLSRADLTGVFSRNCSGTPRLPMGWRIENGTLIGP